MKDGKFCRLLESDTQEAQRRLGNISYCVSERRQRSCADSAFSFDGKVLVSHLNGWQRDAHPELMS